MVPPSIRSNLSALRRRERLLTFVWGLACWLSIALLLLLFCGLVDWLIDRELDTPRWVRETLFSVQIAVTAIAGFWFIVWPQIRRLPDETLALWVEERMTFDHRLISAVQFNQPHARLDGMSKELVALVTREAEKEAQRVGFAQVADHRRLGWGAGVIAPVLVVFALPFLIFPNVSLALLARQALEDVDIPHLVQLRSVSTEIWLQGEPVPIRFRVSGRFDEDMVGRLTVTPEGEAKDRFDLVFIRKEGDEAIFGADVPPTRGASAGYTAPTIRYSARLGDGRTKAPSEMTLVPRPVVVANRAWTILPEFCGKDSVGERYQRPQGGDGDVVGIPGSGVRVQFEVQRPIKKAWLELRGVELDAKPLPEGGTLPEVRKGIVPLRIWQKTDAETNEPMDGWLAEGTFDLVDGLTEYVMCVEDEYGFDNQPKKRRKLRLVPEPPPTVGLLKVTFGLGGDLGLDLEGLPVPLGEKIRIPYRCDGPYGLSRARILYRVLKKHESGKEPEEEEEWSKLEMPEFKFRPDLGPFNLERGIFQGTKYNESVSFFAMPSPEPGRMVGGGRYFLETKDGALLDSKSRPQKLKSGDQIEYCVEVFAAEREPKASIPSARSETRVSTMMSVFEFATWLSQLREEDERVRQLESRQKGIFERK